MNEKVVRINKYSRPEWSIDIQLLALQLDLGSVTL